MFCDELDLPGKVRYIDPALTALEEAYTTFSRILYRSDLGRMARALLGKDNDDIRVERTEVSPGLYKWEGEINHEAPQGNVKLVFHRRQEGLIPTRQSNESIRVYMNRGVPKSIVDGLVQRATDYLTSLQELVNMPFVTRDLI